MQKSERAISDKWNQLHSRNFCLSILFIKRNNANCNLEFAKTSQFRSRAFFLLTFQKVGETIEKTFYLGSRSKTQTDNNLNANFYARDIFEIKYYTLTLDKRSNLLRLYGKHALFNALFN